LSFRLLFKLGYSIRREGIDYSDLFGYWGGLAHRDYRFRWKNPGDEMTTSIPSMVYPNLSGRDKFYSLSESLVERGDHVRLQYIRIQYDIRGGHGTALPFHNLQLYFNAANLGVVWQSTNSGIDPEYGSWSIPPPRQYSFGIAASF